MYPEVLVGVSIVLRTRSLFLGILGSTDIAFVYKATLDLVTLPTCILIFYTHLYAISQNVA